MSTPSLQYPIGEYKKPTSISQHDLSQYIHDIEQLPFRLRKATSGLSNEQLDTPYRPGGWTIRQLIHHIADSHANAIIRVKLALTEDTPTIKPYEEKLWAELADAKMPIDISLHIIEGIHARWTFLLKSLTSEQWKRTFIHPVKGGKTEIQEAAAMYAWHSNHHLAHITQTQKA